MSESEIQRFITDLQSNEALRGELSSQATGIGTIVEFANGKGYEVTAEDVNAHMRSQLGDELSDDELDSIAGGAGTAVAAITGVIVTTNVSGGGAMAVISNNGNIASQAVEVADVQAVVGSTTAAAVVVT